MGQATVHRELRRETKRTLGNKLKEFAQAQHADLVKAGKRLLELEDRLILLENQHQRLADSVSDDVESERFARFGISDRVRRLESLTFTERFWFFVTGALPEVRWSWSEASSSSAQTVGDNGSYSAVAEPSTPEEREAFAQDIGRP